MGDIEPSRKQPPISVSVDSCWWVVGVFIDKPRIFRTTANVDIVKCKSKIF